MNTDSAILQYLVPTLLASLNALVGWTLYTVVKLKGKAEQQETINTTVDLKLQKQEVFNEKVMSRFQAGSKTFVKFAIEFRNLEIWKNKIDELIDEVKEEQREEKSSE